MYTRNYIKGFAARFSGVSTSGKDFDTIVNLKGQTVSANGYLSSFGSNTPITNQSVYFHKHTKGTITSDSDGIVFGDGDAPESLDDYCMAGNHFTTYNATYTRSFEMDDNEAISTIGFTLTNTGATDFTIREIGQIYQQGSSTTIIGLVERTVLESPVTIPAGGIGQVTYTIRVPLTV
jgi:hypothetical protein